MVERRTDLVYHYDGSFAGFLCCVFEAVARKEQPFGVWPWQSAPPTLYPVRRIETRADWAQRVFRSIGPKLGRRALPLVSRVFLSGDPDKDRLLLRFFDFGYLAGPQVCRMVAHDAVAPVLELERQVANETHHYIEFLRFEETEGMLAAVIEPKSCILPLLKGHFCNRFPDETLLIADRTHGSALLWQDHHAQYLELTGDFSLPAPEEEEFACQELWRAFYRTISIDARENPALRRSHCPKRYWHYMTELRDMV